MAILIFKIISLVFHEIFQRSARTVFLLNNVIQLDKNGIKH